MSPYAARRSRAFDRVTVAFPARDGLPLALRHLPRRGLEARHAVALHRRARADAALALDRRHRPRRPPRGLALAGLDLHVPQRAVVADSRRRRRLLRDQVRRRLRDDVGRVPDLSPRATDRRPSRCALRRGGRRRDPLARLLVVDRRGDARVSVCGSVLLPDREGVRDAATGVGGSPRRRAAVLAPAVRGELVDDPGGVRTRRAVHALVRRAVPPGSGRPGRSATGWGASSSCSARSS